MLHGIFVVFIRKDKREYLMLFILLLSSVGLSITEIVIGISIGMYMRYGNIIIESNQHAGKMGNSEKPSFIDDKMRKILPSRQHYFFRKNAFVEPYFRHDNFDIVPAGIFNADFRVIYIVFVTTEKYREDTKQ